MMTPRGVGGYSRRRRHGVVRHAVVLVLAVLLLVGAGVAAWWFTLRTPEPTALPACPRPTVTYTPPVTPAPVAAVKVNVYNSTNRQGLAGRVASDLRKRGFGVLKVANDPLKKAVAGTAEIRFGPAGKSAAETIRRQIDGATVVVDQRKDATVDVALGQAFTALRTPEQVAAAASPTPAPRATTPAPSASPTCTPVPAVTVTAGEFGLSTPAQTPAPKATPTPTKR